MIVAFWTCATVAVELPPQTCCDGPPARSQLNPLQVKRIEKVTLAVESLQETARWWTDTFGFTAGTAFDTPFGQVQRLHLLGSSGIMLELIQSRSPPTRGVILPDPYSHTAIHGVVTQFSFRVWNMSVVDAVLASKGIKQVAPQFSNDQLSLVLAFIRDPTTGILVEFLQPYDAAASYADLATNHLGLLGYNQVTKCVANVATSDAWNSAVLGTILPYNAYVDLSASFGTIVAIAQREHLRLETISNATSVAYNARFRALAAYPNQASVTGVASFAVRLAGSATAAWSFVAASSSLAPSPIYQSPGWGGASFWLSDADGVLVEFFFPSKATSGPAPPTADSTSSTASTTLVGLSLANLVLVAVLVLVVMLIVLTSSQRKLRGAPALLQHNQFDRSMKELPPPSGSAISPEDARASFGS